MTEQTITIDCNIGNEWGWFIDFVDEIEVIDELLKPQINYSRITSVVTIVAKNENTAIIINEESIVKPVTTNKYMNCLNRLLAEIANLLVLGTLYKLAKTFMSYFNN
jgi:hypothetical protein